MKRHFPGLHVGGEKRVMVCSKGCSSCALTSVTIAGIHRSPSSLCASSILEPKQHSRRRLSGRLYCTREALWKLNWFLRDFGYDPDLLGRDEVDEKALLGLTGIIETSRTTLQRAFLPESRSFCTCRGMGRAFSAPQLAEGRTPMIYSYTQISQFLRCPRSYRYRYLDGWQEKEARAAMIFGRCFEKALAAYFCREDPSCRFCSRNGELTGMLRLEYEKGRLLGPALSPRDSSASESSLRTIAFGFAGPKENLQVKMIRSLPKRQRVRFLHRRHRRDSMARAV